MTISVADNINTSRPSEEKTDGQYWPSTTATTLNSCVDAARIKYQKARLLHWNEIARKLENWTGWGGYYHRRLIQVYQSLVAPGKSVLELGCARGDLLAALKPGKG